MLFSPKPRYLVAAEDMRRIYAFQTFMLNIGASDWLVSRYPPGIREGCEELGQKISVLTHRHCILCHYVPLRLNAVLRRMGKPYLRVSMSRPLNAVAYTDKLLDLIKDFCKTYGNVFESEYFLPENCPRGQVPLEIRTSRADELYAYYRAEVSGRAGPLRLSLERGCWPK